MTIVDTAGAGHSVCRTQQAPADVSVDFPFSSNQSQVERHVSHVRMNLRSSLWRDAEEICDGTHEALTVAPRHLEQ